MKKSHRKMHISGFNVSFHQMVKVLTILILTAQFFSTQAQILEVSWESGTSLLPLDPKLAVYGTLEVPDPANHPGYRYNSVSWTDTEDNMWLFGGAFGGLVMNDLWKYDGTNWVWVGGSSSPSAAVYGTQGVADPTNFPGARTEAISWADDSGNIWLFGGNGKDDGTTPWPAYLNDLWKFDGTNWTWVSGSSVAEETGVYGTKGVAAMNNIPGARSAAVSWMDNYGNLWLFGGYAKDSNGEKGYINDLWKFDGTNWTWVSGSNVINTQGDYGTLGVASDSNTPGSRGGSVGWIDSSDNLWLYGGGNFNDLWKYDGTNWTWMKGPSTQNTPAVYGTQGVGDSGNFPRYGSNALNWTDSNGNFWLSGLGTDDLWKYDGTNWIWVSGTTGADGSCGTKGVSDPANQPSGRTASIGWIDSSDNLWLYGGISSKTDLWKFDGTNWTWVGGFCGTYDQGIYGVYGTQGVAASTNVPGARTGSASWADDQNNLWLFGGIGYGETPNSAYGPSGINDLWKYDGANWTWVSGSKVAEETGVYGTKGVAASSNYPGAISKFAHCTDPEGNLWLFGGLGNDKDGTYGFLDDLWKFDGTNWTWISGSGVAYTSEVHNSKGITSGTSTPGGRSGTGIWADLDGNIWIYGGASSSSPATPGWQFMDLWKFDGTNWTWVTGSSVRQQYPNIDNATFGVKGVAAPENHPGTKLQGTTWTDFDGILWLFGGFGSDINGDPGRMNDLWKFDGTNWTWVSGNNTRGSFTETEAVYGEVGIADPSYTPGPIENNPTNWVDSEGNLWLFGGTGIDKYNQSGWSGEFWKFDGQSWAFMGGGEDFYTQGQYGTQGIPSPSNVIGGRYGAASWVDSEDNFWIFGGSGFDGGSLNGYMNDLWKVSIDKTPPSITSALSVSTEENHAEFTYTATADEGVTFTLGSSKDESLFALSTDQISFMDAPDFENPLDGDANNDYRIDLIATDEAGNSSTLEISIMVTDVDEIDPAITSATEVSIEENTSGTIYSATADETVTFSLGDTKDEALFALGTDQISFMDAPDFENPLDGDANNDYRIDLIATDEAGNSSTLEISIMVTDVDEIDPVITSATEVSIEENTSGTIYSATADETVTFSLGDTKDEALFALGTDQISFMDAPDFENPLDGDANNDYRIDLIATDEAGNSSTLEISIMVTDVDEIDPVITSATEVSIEENTSGTIYSATADETVTFSLGDTKDEALFALSTDEISFMDAPDFENPQDGDANNEYVIDLTATDDAGNSATLEITITVTDLDELVPTITSASATSIQENTSGTIYSATADETVTFSLGDTKDESLFALSTDQISFIDAPDFENPQDGDANNEYVIDLTASDDAGNSATLEITITVTDLDELVPTITSASAISIEENTSGTIYSATADETVTFSLGDTKDESLFALSTDQISFIDAPDFENPQDGDANNEYVIDLTATDDAGNSATLEITITVTDLDELVPTITSASATSIQENTSGTIYSATADETVAFSLGDTKDESLFALSTDQISFIDPPDFENPQDGDANNEYIIDLTATDDAGNSTTLEITITVTDLDDTALGTQDENGNMIKLYPNPTSEFVNVGWINFKQATISEISGKELLKSDTRTLDLRELSAGIYLITLSGTNNERITFRILKKE